jgi:type I restriction enzyme S subunit
VGATAYVDQVDPNVVLPDKIWKFIWHSDRRVEPFFVWFLFRQPAFRNEIGKRATGTSGSMKNISQNKVLNLRVGLPPLDQQREFSKQLAYLNKHDGSQRAQLRQFDALFASLQHSAFRGEL